MREIQASTITDVVEKLCIEANYHLPEDVKCAITGCRACEDGEIAKGVLDKIVENYEIADAQNVPRSRYSPLAPKSAGSTVCGAVPSKKPERFSGK